MRKPGFTCLGAELLVNLAVAWANGLTSGGIFSGTYVRYLKLAGKIRTVERSVSVSFTKIEKFS